MQRMVGILSLVALISVADAASWNVYDDKPEAAITDLEKSKAGYVYCKISLEEPNESAAKKTDTGQPQITPPKEETVQAGDAQPLQTKPVEQPLEQPGDDKKVGGDVPPADNKLPEDPNAVIQQTGGPQVVENGEVEKQNNLILRNRVLAGKGPFNHSVDCYFYKEKHEKVTYTSTQYCADSKLTISYMKNFNKNYDYQGPKTMHFLWAMNEKPNDKMENKVENLACKVNISSAFRVALAALAMFLTLIL